MLITSATVVIVAGTVDVVSGGVVTIVHSSVKS